MLPLYHMGIAYIHQSFCKGSLRKQCSKSCIIHINDYGLGCGFLSTPNQSPIYFYFIKMYAYSCWLLCTSQRELALAALGTHFNNQVVL